MTNQIKLGLYGIGLDTYWSQFEGLLDELQGHQERLATNIADMGVHVVDAGMVDNPKKATEAAERFRRECVESVSVSPVCAQSIPADSGSSWSS